MTVKTLNPILVLYLDAPLQSWGYQSRFDRRTTLSWPTRSGIIGMICAAMGIDRGDNAALARFSPLVMTTLILRPADNERNPGSRLIDFHTVGGGYDVKNERQCMPRKASGGTPATVVTYREYLQDAKFGVLLSGQTIFLTDIKSSMENPKWGIFFGRKSCIPASPVCQGIFVEEAAAIARLEEISGWIVERIVREVKQYPDGSDTLVDIPYDFKRRQFCRRRIRNDLSF